MTYKTAEAHINKGLSLVPRILLGLVAGLFGAVMLIFGIDGFTRNVENWFAYFAFGLFLSLIALACFTWGRVRQFTGSCIGIILFGIACWYLITELSGGVFISDRRSEPSVWNAILFMGAFGIPGLSYTFLARFGFRKHAGNEHP